MTRRAALVAAGFGLILLGHPRATAAQTLALPPGPELCGILTRCGLGAPRPACTDAFARGVAGVTYDDDRCSDPRRLYDQGITPADLLGARAYRFLGRRYRVAYVVEGRAAVSRARFVYLVGDLPFSAKLLSRFQGRAYFAEYLDGGRRRFRGNMGKTLRGEAELLAGTADGGRLAYFGLGTSRVGPWSLTGQAFLEVEFAADPAGKGITYRIRVLASPVNAVVDLVMRLGVFRGLVERHVREVLSDITTAMQKLEGGGLAPGLQKDFTLEEREKLRALLSLP